MRGVRTGNANECMKIILSTAVVIMYFVLLSPFVTKPTACHFALRLASRIPEFTSTNIRQVPKYATGTRVLGIRSKVVELIQVARRIIGCTTLYVRWRNDKCKQFDFVLDTRFPFGMLLTWNPGGVASWKRGTQPFLWYIWVSYVCVHARARKIWATISCASKVWKLINVLN